MSKPTLFYPKAWEVLVPNKLGIMIYDQIGLFDYDDFEGYLGVDGLTVVLKVYLNEGDDVSELKVMKSNAGWYLGHSCIDEECGGIEVPHSRAGGYYGERKEAEDILKLFELSQVPQAFIMVQEGGRGFFAVVMGLADDNQVPGFTHEPHVSGTMSYKTELECLEGEARTWAKEEGLPLFDGKDYINLNKEEGV